jgi:hypothetical protein
MTMAITLHTDVEELPEQTELLEARVRDAFQLHVDADVAALKQSTAKAGWPEPNPARLFQRYVVGKDDMAALKNVIRRAGTLLHVEPVFYKNGTTEAGHVVVKFHVTRKLDKEGKLVKDDSLTEDGKPTPKLAGIVAAAQASAKEAAERESAPE